MKHKSNLKDKQLVWYYVPGDRIMVHQLLDMFYEYEIFWDNKDDYVLLGDL